MEKEFSIEGMHCGSCAALIKETLEETEGVVQATVSFDDKIAFVEYDPNKLETNDVQEIVSELGYKATLTN